MDAVEQLLEIYRKNPCRTLPNAFWKTAAALNPARLEIEKDATQRLESLAVWKGDQLLAYWCAKLEKCSLSESQISQVPFALVHNDAVHLFSKRAFRTKKPYFRLRQQAEVAPYDLPRSYRFETVQPDVDLKDVAGLIRACYQDIQISEEIVKGWMTHPVYMPDLWIWIVENRSGKNIALGIAEYNPRVPEASLEWIQVLPGYQQQGLGSALVVELLQRIPHQAAFTTVAGEIENPHDPEGLYRKCGFSGKDRWWLLAE